LNTAYNSSATKLLEDSFNCSLCTHHKSLLVSKAVAWHFT